MIRVLVVEDESPILRAIVKMIGDYSEEYVVTATANNGKKALEELRRQDFDLLFTDIKMPVMDGLELAKEVHEHYPHMLTVIISGYQDFAFARQALQYQVFDYLSKPVSHANLHALLEKIEVTIAARANESRRRKIVSAINNAVDSLPSPAKTEGEYGVLLLCAGPFPLTPDESMLPARAFWDQVDLDSVMQEIFPSPTDYMSFNGKSVSEKILLITLKKENTIPALAELVSKSMAQFSSLPVTIVADPIPAPLSATSSVFSALRTHLYTHIKLCKADLLWLNEPPKESSSSLFTSELIKTLQNSLSMSTEQAVTSILMELLTHMGSSDTTQLEAEQFFESLLDTLVQKKSLDRKLALYKMDIQTAVSNAIDFSELAADIASIVWAASRTDEKSEPKSNSDPLIDEIEEYLKTNYNKSITNTILSQRFGLVPSYLSKLFRSRKGVSPSEYLTHLRINLAQKLMQDNPRMMVKEVADKVGYNDQYYFSKIFKKDTGVWPSEYIGKLHRS